MNHQSFWNHPNGGDQKKACNDHKRTVFVNWTTRRIRLLGSPATSNLSDLLETIGVSIQISLLN